MQAEDDLIASTSIPSRKTPQSRSREQTLPGERQESGHSGDTHVSASVDSNEDLGILDEDLLRNRKTKQTGYVGKNSDIQWLRSVQRQAERTEAEPYGLSNGPAGMSESAVGESSKARHERRELFRRESILHSADSTFYLDDDDIEVDVLINPNEMPEPAVADLLFNCYMDTVHSSFPILPTNFEDQCRRFYESARLNRSFEVPDKWRAIVNLVFAIGAKYSHLVNARWRGDERNHVVYMKRAVHLLNLRSNTMIISGPDLGLIQAVSVFILL